MKKETLIKIIHDAFDGVKIPSDITLRVADPQDYYDFRNNAQYRELEHLGRWQDLPVEDFRDFQDALCFVDEEGMRYYLPAYMTFYLRHYDDDIIVRTDHTLYALRPSLEDHGQNDYFKKRFSLFTPTQLKACALFVKYCSIAENNCGDETFALEIYESYWQQFVD